jgi:hypothetical protein
MRHARSIACGCPEIFEFANDTRLLLLGNGSENTFFRAFLRIIELFGISDFVF